MSETAREIELAAQAWLAGHLPRLEPSERSGAVLRTEGELITASNLAVPIGSRCTIATRVGPIGAEGVGLDGRLPLLMADRSPKGLQRGNRVTAVPGGVSVTVGAGLLGRVLDAYGNPLDDRPPPATGQS